MASTEKVTQFLQDLSTVAPTSCDQVGEIRQLFLQADPGVSETIKYGGLVFMLGASNRLLGGVFVYRKHLSVEFGSGAQFEDPEGLLEGRGQYRRHIKIHQPGDVEGKQLLGFIQQAIKLHKH